MKKGIRVVIADANTVSMQKLGDFLKSKADINVLGMFDDGQKCFDYLCENEVDVVLMDLILPNIDGVGILEKASYMKNKPEFIVVSSLKNEGMIQTVSSFGAKYYIAKPYDEDLLYSRIVQVAKRENNKEYSSLDEKITSVFLMVGIPAHIKGFHYLRDGVKLVIEDTEYINKITKELYPTIASHFDTTPSKVERAIRHAIEVAWNRGKIENINEVFGYKIYGKNDKPTNGEFIALMADRLSLGNYN